MAEDYVAWCKAHFDSLADGGMWGIPRSGLIFGRSGDVLRLLNRMPWQEGMEISERRLRQEQQKDFEQIRDHFHKAGIPVFDIGE